MKCACQTGPGVHSLSGFIMCPAVRLGWVPPSCLLPRPSCFQMFDEQAGLQSGCFSVRESLAETFHQSLDVCDLR